MRYAPIPRPRGLARALVPILSLAPGCGRQAAGLLAEPAAPPVLEASLLTAVLIAGPLLVAAVAVITLLRRRRGPEPLSRLLIAGSLRDMQRPRPIRRGEQ